MILREVARLLKTIMNQKEQELSDFTGTEFNSLTSAFLGVPFMAPQLTNLIRIHEDAGSIPGLAQ